MQSMTGFGKAVSEFTDKKVVIEIKSLNSKQLDLYTKINSFYRSKELEIRNLIQQELGRGKVEFSLMVDQVSEASAGVQINKVAFNNYLNQIKEISEETGVALPNDWFTVIMRMPEVLRTEQNEELSEEEWEKTLTAVKDAIKACEKEIEFELFLKDKTLFLPLDQRYDKSDIEYIINVVNNLLEEYK